MLLYGYKSMFSYDVKTFLSREDAIIIGIVLPKDCKTKKETVFLPLSEIL